MCRPDSNAPRRKADPDGPPYRVGLVYHPSPPGRGPRRGRPRGSENAAALAGTPRTARPGAVGHAGHGTAGGAPGAPRHHSRTVSGASAALCRTRTHARAGQHAEWQSVSIVIPTLLEPQPGTSILVHDP